MRIAFTTKGTDWNAMMDPRFGRTDYFLLYDEEFNQLKSLDNRTIGEDAHGAGPKTVQTLSELQPDVLITGNGPGRNAIRALEVMNVKIYVGAGKMTAGEAFEAYKNNVLHEFVIPD